ncbi:hypothetical protein A176_003564 [Myxococcus hansupus]|uniref:Uncharacterized protein n=1 Tax=Pseudomyxococcus hansupus TaxID=1297742 RepID=A0A0H4XES4_9BACT|nr:hypothetical protein A176_003564 [Myxococcus hansupus]
MDLAAQYDTGVSVSEAGALWPNGLPTYVASGVRKVDCVGGFERLALGAWPAEIRAGVEEKAAAAGLPAGQLLGVMEERLPPLDDAAREKLEALSFMEATEVLAALGATRTGQATLRFLAEKRGD